MVTVAMRNGFAWAQRWELETSGPFTLRRPDFRNGSQPVKLGMSIFRLFDIRQQTFAADSRPSGTDEAAGAPSCPNR
jgi:hypothetical protein